mgnify:CR=1 FL=1
MGETVHIRVLGASFTIQTDQRPEYVETLVSYLKEKIRLIEGSTGSKESLKTAILVSLLIADELFEERKGRSSHQADVDQERRVESFARDLRDLIDQIDAVLEDGPEEIV